MTAEVKKIEIGDERQMERVAQVLAQLVEAGDVIGLQGDLGAGKTFLTRAFARAFGVPEEVRITSPTFTLINEYFGGKTPIYHMDLYRLGSPSELYELGLWEYYDNDGVCFVEWCDRFEDLWPDRALVLSITLGQGTKRSIYVTGKGRGKVLAEELCSSL